MRIKPCFEYQCIWNPVRVGEEDPSWHDCTGDSSFGLYQVCSWNGLIVAPLLLRSGSNDNQYALIDTDWTCYENETVMTCLCLVSNVNVFDRHRGNKCGFLYG